MPPPQQPRKSPHFFVREDDGSVRLRIRFTPDEADLIEEGAGDTPLLAYIHRQIMDRARLHAERARRQRHAELNRLAEADTDKDSDD